MPDTAETTKTPPKLRQLNIRMDDELYAAVVRKAAEEQMVTGAPTPASDWARRALAGIVNQPVAA